MEKDTKKYFKKGISKISALFLILITLSLSIAFLWKLMDIPKTPDPAIWKGCPKDEVWRKFFSISIPLIYGFYTLLYAILLKLIPASRRRDIDELYRCRRYDFLTYALLPLFLLMMILWRYLWDWYLFFGIFYLAIVFIKTAILSKLIYRWIWLIENPSPQSSPIRGEGKGTHIRWGLFLSSLLLYAFISLWVNYSISTTGDEQTYLLVTHSLLFDRDLDLKNNIEQKDYRRFSWVYFPRHNLFENDGKFYSTANSLLCILLLPGYALGSILPDYALGERLGALLINNLIAAWLLLELFLFTTEISKSLRAAFISWAVVGFTSPVFFFSSQIYPEIAGALVLLFALRRLLKPDFEWKGSVVVISALVLVSLKMRFAPLALILPVLWAFISHQRKMSLRILVSGIGIIGLVIFALLIDKVLFNSSQIHNQLKNLEWILHCLTPKQENLSALLGLIFDQEFGLLFYSPLYSLGLIGIPYLLSRYRRVALVIILPVLIYTFVIIGYHTIPWFGGWSLPSRYIVVVIPLIGLMAGIIIGERQGLITTFLTRAIWIWSISIVFILNLVTFWRYNSANGANILLRQIEEIFSTRITRFFPSFISPTQEGLIISSGLLVFFIMASLLVLRKKPLEIASQVPAPSLHSVEALSKKTRLSLFTGGILLLLVSGGLIIILGRSLPTQQLEAENMKHTSGIQYRDMKKNVWILREKGMIWDYVVLPDNRTIFVNILAAGQCNAIESPRIVVRIGGEKIGEIDILYGKDFWLDSYYTFQISPMKRGMYPFSIELTNGIYDLGRGRFCGIYVDRVEFRN